MKKLFILLVFIPVLALAEPMYSPTWGFHIDLPEGYKYVDGNGIDVFSFSGYEGLMFDLMVYKDRFNTLLELINFVNERLSNQGDVDFFQYRDKQAAVMSLTFGEQIGWGLAIELENPDGSSGKRPVLLALAYGPADRRDLELFHLSALDSICPTTADRYYPGPLTEYSYPRGTAKSAPIAVRGLSAMIRDNDAEAAQVLIEREFIIYNAYLNTQYLQAAAIRYYRFVYRDSYDRIADAVAAIVRNFGGHSAVTDEQKRVFAQRTLAFVQGFHYERDLSGSADFINLVTVVQEGRGSCDSHSVLFAMLLANANIRSAIMLSHHYSHAMGLADVTGVGTRINFYGVQWLVAETTAKFDIGQITEDMSDGRLWFGVMLD